MAVARVQTSRRQRRLPRDGCVVPTDPLATLVRGFLTDWSRTRPTNSGRFGAGDDRTEVTFVAGADWLAAEAGVSRDKIQSVVQRRQTHTELHVADALVAALGRPDLLYDGTLPIMPNPLASAAARASCCGSLTGAA